MTARAPKRLNKIAIALTAVFTAAITTSLIAIDPAQAAPAGVSLSMDMGEGGEFSNRIIQMLALITVLSLAPSILVMTTSFVRIVIVFSLLRTAMGLQQSPPNTVVISLALFLSAFIMAPVFTDAYENGIRPFTEQEIEAPEAFSRASEPFKAFMLRHTRDEDLGLFIDISQMDTPESAQELPLQVITPAFLLSEIRRAFEIGFLLFIPFLVIDLVVASILMSMGMMMLPPVMISMPFKLIFFVLVDGWRLVASGLVESFGAQPL